VEKRAAKPEATTPAPKPAAATEPAPPPAIVRALLPEVHVEQTRWHPDAARRTARIEMDGGPHEVQEGDVLGPLVVTTIEPSGVVFLHQGVEMRRRVGE
jgi:hypothetical protein